jgi:ribosomal protein L32
MPHEPKKRHSRARQGKRRASISLTVTNLSHRLAKYLTAEKASAVKE